MKRFSCCDVIPGCDRVFTGVDDDSLLEQVMAHAAADHGLVQPPPALAELVAATTYTVPTSRSRNHLRLLGREDEPAPAEPQMEHPAAAGHHPDSQPDSHPGAQDGAAVLAFPRMRHSADGASAAPAPHRDPESAHHHSYRHECFFYRGTDDFVDALVPFIRDGLALDQPVMVAVIEPRASALREALGADAEAVVFVDMAALGANPARIIPAWRAFTDDAAGQPTRGIGEPIWAGRRPAEIVEGQFHEALLNLAPDEGTPLWLVCPYDVDALDESVIEEAMRSHPFHTGTPADMEYAGQAHALEFFSAPLPEPVGQVTALTGTAPVGNASDGTTLAGTAPDDTEPDDTAPVGTALAGTASGGGQAAGGVATQVLEQAAAAGLSDLSSARLATAVDAVTGAATGEVTVRVWQEPATLVFQIDDSVALLDPLVGRAGALPLQGPERGIRLANELCDLVQVRSGESGTSVRLYSWL